MVANYFLALLSTPWPACWSTWNLLLCTANAAVCRAILPGWLTYVYIREPAQTSLRNLFLAEIASSAGGAIEIRSRGQGAGNDGIDYRFMADHGCVGLGSWARTEMQHRSSQYFRIQRADTEAQFFVSLAWMR
ncbi:hypothetical protein V8E55_011258 [Tylopilus felleus]